jgi:hypothetical protein
MNVLAGRTKIQRKNVSSNNWKLTEERLCDSALRWVGDGGATLDKDGRRTPVVVEGRGTAIACIFSCEAG